MMDRKKRKPLSRGGKTVRNLLLAALAGVLVWINAGAPLPPEQEFQRLVQKNFLEDEVQFLGNFETSGLHWGAGLTDQWLVLGALDRRRMELWPREGDGPVVAPAPDDFARWSEIAFVAADAPEGTASAQLTIDLSCWYTHTGTATNGTWSYWASEDQDSGAAPLPPTGRTPILWRGNLWRMGPFYFICRSWTPWIRETLSFWSGAIWRTGTSISVKCIRKTPTGGPPPAPCRRYSMTGRGVSWAGRS